MLLKNKKEFLVLDNSRIATMWQHTIMNRWLNTRSRKADLDSPCWGASRPVHSTGMASYLSKLMPFVSVSKTCSSSSGGGGGTYGGGIGFFSPSALTAENHKVNITAISFISNRKLRCFPRFFLSLQGGTCPFMYQCWGLPQGLAKCTAPGVRQVCSVVRNRQAGLTVCVKCNAALPLLS